MASSHETSRIGHDLNPSVSRDGGKRKRDEGDKGLSRSSILKIPAIDVASATTSAAGSPLHSPISSTGNAQYSNGVNGATSSTRRAAVPQANRIVQKRNIDRVQFGQYDIRTWYFSPYQFDDEEWASLAATAKDAKSSTDDEPADGGRSMIAPMTSSVIAGGLQSEAGSSKPRGALSNGIDQLPAALHVNGHSAAATQEEPSAKSIWVCEGCFKYMRTYSGFRAHKRDCRHSHPPGRKVYQRGAHTIWEVDGAQQKLYAQNLSLFGKLFIDHKTIYFDVEPFVFYVLTDATSSFDHVLGYFSKEKVSYDDYNLACIITFPPFQKSGFGTLMIEFSYYLSGLTDVLGTPERPLSDLGLKGYLSFWSSVALRTLALFFNDREEDVHARLLPAAFTPQKGRHHAQTAANNAAMQLERQNAECKRLRGILLGKSQISSQIELGSSPRRGDATSNRSSRGWAGEVPKKKSNGDVRGSSASISVDDSMDDVQPDDPIVDPKREIDSLTTTLDLLAQATSLRIDDLCFALSECGLLLREQTSPSKQTNGNDDHGGSNLRLIITQGRVRQALKRLNVKRPVMDVQYVLL